MSACNPRRTTPAPEPQMVPWIVADFEFEGVEWLVVLWPPERDDDGRWKSQPYEDRRA